MFALSVTYAYKDDSTAWLFFCAKWIFPIAWELYEKLLNNVKKKKDSNSPCAVSSCAFLCNTGAFPVSCSWTLKSIPDGKVARVGCKECSWMKKCKCQSTERGRERPTFWLMLPKLTVYSADSQHSQIMIILWQAERLMLESLF